MVGEYPQFVYILGYTSFETQSSPPSATIEGGLARCWRWPGKTRLLMSAFGYEPTSGDPLWNVRLGPGSRHCGARSRPPFLGVRESLVFGIARIALDAPNSASLQLSTAWYRRDRTMDAARSLATVGMATPRASRRAYGVDSRKGRKPYELAYAFESTSET